MEIELILKKLQDNLTPEEEMEFENWLNSSEENKLYFRKFKENFHSKSNIRIDTAKAWKKISIKTSASRRNNWIYSAAAAILVIAFLAYNFMGQDNSLSEPQVASEEIAEPQEIIFTNQKGQKVVLNEREKIVGSYYTTEGEKMKLKESATEAAGVNSIYVPKGRIFNLELSDGTIVHLNSDSEFSFPSSFKKSDTREVHLIRGEAYFEVTPNTQNDNKAFVVVNSDQKIEVIGTEFNVKAYEGESIATTLAEGKISLKTNSEKVILIPGEQSIVNPGIPGIEVNQVDVSEVIGWKEGVFNFTNIPLSDLLNTLSRWYDVKINFYAGERLREEKFNGVFTKKQELQEILKIIESNSKARFEINGKKVNVTEN